MLKKPKVFVGVSGGVDSSVSLALLKNEGFDVTGVFLKVWNPDFLTAQAGLPCNWKEERRSAMRVCATLGVPFKTIDCVDEYKKEVVDYMIKEYSEGRVPNPDIFCNKYVKFGVFLRKALEMGADFVATGHYARVEKSEDSYKLLEGVDKNKDQSYFLYTLGQKELEHTLFPVGHMKKEEVRKLASKFKLPTSDKKDSQGLCFIGKIDLKDFLSHYVKTEKGNVLNTGGEIIGEHPGAIFFAIGQRHGFKITKKGSSDPRFFVVKKDMAKNTITVADNSKEDFYSAKGVVVKNMHFIDQEIKDGESLEVRIRYRQEKKGVLVNKTKDGYKLTFKSPENGVSEGQSAVLYKGDICFGGGIIEEVF